MAENINESKKIKVSIIIPVYNVEQYLRQCLDSVVSQTYSNLEIICVNDGTKDNSVAIIKEYAERDNRIVLLNKENSGQAAARNFAFPYVTGDYVMFLDSDDWIERTTVQLLLEEALVGNADAVMCAYVREYEGKALKTDIFETERFMLSGDEVKKKFHRRLYGPIGKELGRPEKVDAPISAWGQLFKRDMALSAQFVDTRIIGTFEDGLYQISIYDKCNKFVYINCHLYHYRKNNLSSLTTVYRDWLFDRWNNLYDILENNIGQCNYGSEYRQALNNRIALGMIGLSLNEINSNLDFQKKVSRFKQILVNPRYKKAIENLNVRYMPIYWKVFFILCKCKFAFALTLMVKIVSYLRSKISK